MLGTANAGLARCSEMTAVADVPGGNSSAGASILGVGYLIVAIYLIASLFKGERAGANPHNAVEADGLWSTETVFGSLDQFEGDEAVLTYDEAGEYVFFCTYHGNSGGAGMAGTLIVGDG